MGRRKLTEKEKLQRRKEREEKKIMEEKKDKVEAVANIYGIAKGKDNENEGEKETHEEFSDDTINEKEGDEKQVGNDEEEKMSESKEEFIDVAQMIRTLVGYMETIVDYTISVKEIKDGNAIVDKLEVPIERFLVDLRKYNFNMLFKKVTYLTMSKKILLTPHDNSWISEGETVLTE